MSRWICIDELEYDTDWDSYADGFTAYSQLAIDTAPSLDLVTCSECKHWTYEESCEVFNKPMCFDDFCSYGEREGE